MLFTTYTTILMAILRRHRTKMGSITAEPLNLPACGTTQPDPIIEVLTFHVYTRSQSASILRTAELLTDGKRPEWKVP